MAASSLKWDLILSLPEELEGLNTVICVGLRTNQWYEADT